MDTDNDHALDAETHLDTDNDHALPRAARSDTKDDHLTNSTFGRAKEFDQSIAFAERSDKEIDQTLAAAGRADKEVDHCIMSAKAVQDERERQKVLAALMDKEVDQSNDSSGVMAKETDQPANPSGVKDKALDRPIEPAAARIKSWTSAETPLKTGAYRMTRACSWARRGAIARSDVDSPKRRPRFYRKLRDIATPAPRRVGKARRLTCRGRSQRFAATKASAPAMRWLKTTTATQSSSCSFRARTRSVVYPDTLHSATTGLPLASRRATPVVGSMSYRTGTESPRNACANCRSSAERRATDSEKASMRKKTAPEYFRSSAACPSPGTSAEYRNARPAEMGGASARALARKSDESVGTWALARASRAK